MRKSLNNSASCFLWNAIWYPEWQHSPRIPAAQTQVFLVPYIWGPISQLQSRSMNMQAWNISGSIPVHASPPTLSHQSLVGLLKTLFMLSTAVSHHLLQTDQINQNLLFDPSRQTLLWCIPGNQLSRSQIAGAQEWEPVASTGGGNIAKDSGVFMQRWGTARPAAAGPLKPLAWGTVPQD